MAKEKNQNVINLLWTGGWDSTFRLLQLILMEKKKVQPYYIMDPDRSSLGYELRAMQKIKNQLFMTHPDLRDLLFQTIFIEKHFIPPNKSISDAFKRLRKHVPFGAQYEWLSSFASVAGVKALEIGAERATGQIADFMGKRLIKTQEDGMTLYKIDEQLADTDVYTLFKYYRFPIREISKVDMREISIRNGFDHLMELTWFCHHPRRNGKPCGICTPCIQAFKFVMKFRLPFFSRLRFYFRMLLNRDQFKLGFPVCYRLLFGMKSFFSRGEKENHIS